MTVMKLLLVPEGILLDMIQKCYHQRVDSDTADGWSCFPRNIDISGCPFSDTPGIILRGFGRAEFTEVDSFAIDTDEGGASVVSHLGGI